MKTIFNFFKVFFFMSFFLINSVAKAQEKEKSSTSNTNPTDTIFKKKILNYIIEYDFEKSSYSKANVKPKQKVPTILKIKNINPLFYKIEITPKDIAIKDDFLYEVKKDSVKKIETKIFEANDVELTRQLYYFETLNSKTTTAANNLNKNIEKIDSLKNQIDENRNELKKLDSIGLVQRGKDLDGKFNTLQEELKDENKTLATSLDKIKNVEDLKSNLSKKLFFFNKNYLDYYKYSTDLLGIANKYNNYIDKINRPELTYNDYINFNKDSNNIESVSIIKKDKLNEYYGLINTFDDEYIKLVKSYFETTNNKIIDKAKSLNNSDKDFNEFYNLFIIACNKIRDNAKQIHDEVVKMKLSKKLNQVETLNRILSNKDNYEFVSIPIQGLEDYLEFDIKIYSKAKFNESLAIDKSKSFKYFEYLKGGIRYDFSVGTVFDFGVKNKTYEVVPNYSDPKVYNLQQIDNNKFNPTIAGMFHTSFRNTSMYAFGISLGASLNTAKLDINSIFTGVSLLIGKREKIIFTTGPSFIKTSELKSQYVTQPIVEQGFNAATAVVENFKVGFFFGISYNLTKKQKDSFKIN